MLIRAALIVAFALAGGDWTTHAPLPVARTEVAAATVGREIAVVGGFLENGGSSRRVDLYAPGSDTWRAGPDLPAAVNHAAATVARGRLYVAGGYGAERSMFVLEGDRWQTIPMPAPRAAAGAGALRGTVYVVGGVGTGGNARTMLGYEEKRWRREAPVPDSRGGTGAAVVGGRIVSVGGEAPGGTVRTVYAYDVSKRRWSRLADLRTPRHGLGVAAYGGAVYVIGGGPQPGLYVSDANESLNVVG